VLLGHLRGDVLIFHVWVLLPVPRPGRLDHPSSVAIDRTDINTLYAKDKPATVTLSEHLPFL